MMKSKWIGLAVAVLIWFLSIFAVPVVIELVTAGSTKPLASVYKVEIDKRKILNDFQEKIIKKHGILKSGDIPTKERILDLREYVDNEYKKILKYDEEMINQMARTAKINRWLSVFFPTANYWAINNELSGSGYDGLLNFYQFIKTTKLEFLKTYMEKVLFSGQPVPKAEPFLKGNDNIFKLFSRIPGTFPLGLAFNLIYIGFFLKAMSRRYKRNLFTLPVNQKKRYSENKLELKYGKISVFTLRENRFLDHLFCLLSNCGKEFKNKGYNYLTTLDGKDLTTMTETLSFIYLVPKEKMPLDLKVGHFVSFLMRLVNTNKEQRDGVWMEPGFSEMLKRPLHKLDNNEYGMVLTTIMNTGLFNIIVLADAFKYISESTAKKLKNVIDSLTLGKEALTIMAVTHETFFEKEDESVLFLHNTAMMGILDGFK